MKNIKKKIHLNQSKTIIMQTKIQTDFVQSLSNHRLVTYLKPKKRLYNTEKKMKKKLYNKNHIAEFKN